MFRLSAALPSEERPGEGRTRGEGGGRRGRRKRRRERTGGSSPIRRRSLRIHAASCWREDDGACGPAYACTRCAVRRPGRPVLERPRSRPWCGRQVFRAASSLEEPTTYERRAPQASGEDGQEEEEGEEESQPLGVDGEICSLALAVKRGRPASGTHRHRRRSKNSSATSGESFGES